MATRLVNVVVDAVRPAESARFWAELLGWRVSLELADEIDLRAPPDDGWDLDLVFVPVSEPKTVRNRVHLDLASVSPDHQASIVDKAMSLGAKQIDVGQGTVPWIVLADPDGNEFCVLEHRPEYAGTGAVAAIVLAAADPPRLAEFWSAATGWPVVEAGAWFASLRAPDGRGPWLEFLPTDHPHTVKNRVHLDVAPDNDGTVAAEVARLTAAGATPADIGQGDVPWTVLADPEGNEICVLTPR
jgi:catechol 2,3-dioxygenase-like lactoylglutathione lyase family enzyme